MVPSASNEGWFGHYGGRFVAETLVPALDELSIAYADASKDPAFRDEVQRLLLDYVGRPTPLTYAERLSHELGVRVWLKREDLCHTGAHKINNTVGQILLAKRMGKTRVIAETGAGQHGVATATACALLGLPCEVYMGSEDVSRQAPNVSRMHFLGAKVNAVNSGSRTLKDAMNEALRDWVTNVRTTYYCVGSVAGPHPYPTVVRDFQRVIGDEARKQMLDRTNALPGAVVACVGGGSNAMGIFLRVPGRRGYSTDRRRGCGRWRGQRPSFGLVIAGCGRCASWLQGAWFCRTAMARSWRLIRLPRASTILELALSMRGSKRQVARSTTPSPMMRRSPGFISCHEPRGILAALETSHAFGFLPRLARETKDASYNVLVCLSGRGDKDLDSIRKVENR